MRRAILTTIILSSMTIFNGCSGSEPSIDKSKSRESRALDVENMIGINIEEGDALLVVEDEKLPKYHFIMDRSREIPSIEELETAQTYPIYQSVDTPKYNYFRDRSGGNIEIVSYGNGDMSDELIRDLESNAKSFLGTKYVWGATGPNKFDCSGFTQWVFRDIGIDIPRVSRDQARVGEYVSFEDLKKGDMVFFDTKKIKRGIVTHVGYI